MRERSALTLRGVVKSFGALRAVDGVDLDVARGEIHALVGLNGAGKTTLMRLALGMQLPDVGDIEVLGERLVRGECEAWPFVGHLVETPALYGELTARDNVTVTARLRGLRGMDAAAASASALAAMRLDAWADRRASTLSLGNRQRVGLAGALLGQPELLVLDEPANALDPSGVVLVRAMLEDAAARGCGVLVSSHHLDEVARIADRISVVHRGRLVGCLPPGEADLEHAFFELVLAADGGSDAAAQATP
ncbi:MAG: type transport system ATP-binding protein [Solirubrobacteraceae bacterium]|jgi:ABC-2 type transport system ATP-binding protein|nr:type transport system ATP-binding protein [Solirubrobacteraceae bacterium]